MKRILHELNAMPPVRTPWELFSKIWNHTYEIVQEQNDPYLSSFGTKHLFIDLYPLKVHEESEKILKERFNQVFSFPNTQNLVEFFSKYRYKTKHLEDQLLEIKITEIEAKRLVLIFFPFDEEKQRLTKLIITILIPSQFIAHILYYMNCVLEKKEQS